MQNYYDTGLDTANVKEAWKTWTGPSKTIMSY